MRIVRGMVEDKAVQADVLRSGKVDTIVSEPIGVMLLHERMVSGSRPGEPASRGDRFGGDFLEPASPAPHPLSTRLARSH